METTYHKTNIEKLVYPVGQYINENIPKILLMVEAFKQITDFKDTKLSLICRGSSGAIIATMFAAYLPNECRIVHIKKEGESSHSGSISLRKDYRNIIVDDFIATGKTMNAIYQALVADGYGGGVNIDCLCVTGEVYDLDFKPKHFIHSY